MASLRFECERDRILEIVLHAPGRLDAAHRAVPPATPRSCGAAVRPRGGSSSALRWTKDSLNSWLRMAGPTVDTSLALEFLGFSGPDAKESVDAAGQEAGRLHRSRPAVAAGRAGTFTWWTSLDDRMLGQLV